MIDAQRRQIDLFGGQGVNELGDPLGHDRVHVILESPAAQRLRGVAGADGRLEVVEIGVEVVIRNDENALVRMLEVIGLELGDGLEPKRGLAAPFFAENESRRRIGGAAEKLVPGGMMDLGQTSSLEDGIGLRIFLAERVADDAVMLEKLFGLHPQ